MAPHKGGYSTPTIAPELEEGRAALLAWMQAQPDGTVFTKADALEATDLSYEAAFDAVQGGDHLPLPHGLHVAIREGRYVRTLPDPAKTAAAWCVAMGWGQPTPFGDWTAWEEGIALYEPLAGRRFRVAFPGADSVLALGRARIRIVEGLPWLLDERPEGRIARALCDIPHKTLDADLARWAQGGTGRERRALLESACLLLDEADDGLWRMAKSDGRGWRPSEAAASARASMERLGWVSVQA